MPAFLRVILFKSQTNTAVKKSKKIHLTSDMKKSLLQSAGLRSLTGLLHTNLTENPRRAAQKTCSLTSNSR
jgi:hypothetical protein